MINSLKEGLWTQFGASIDMLDNAIRLWPGDNGNERRRFFFIAYHTLVFLDYYLTNPPDNFVSALPFTLASPDTVLDKDALDDVVPDRMYSKDELLLYLQACRRKCHDVIEALTEDSLSRRWVEHQEAGAMNYSAIEILLYNMRHVQHHAAQLNMLLRQQLNDAPGWVARAKGTA
jgi:hypothetical protein